jgi:hypothetical protein
MSRNLRRLTMTTTNIIRPAFGMAFASALCLGILVAGCGPAFDPASLIESTRVVGARTEVEGAPDRATPAPGETVGVTWLVTSPEATPPLSWIFAACAPGDPGAGSGTLGCTTTPLAVFRGTANPPQLSLPVPAADVLGTARNLVLYGEICVGADSTPIFDATSGIPTCSGSGSGTTTSLSLPLQVADEANHNPTADRAFTLDGQVWPAPLSGDDACAVGPRVPVGTVDHVIGNATAGSDRETYLALVDDQPVLTPTRESLQISQFSTSGKLKNQFSFVEATDDSPETIVDVGWNAPPAADVPAAGLPVTFTFVLRDSRGGTDWTTRAACVSR